MARKTRFTDLIHALLQSAQGEHVVPLVMQDLETLREVFDHGSLLTDLAETAVPLEQRQKALQSALKDQVHPYVLNLLLILQEREQLQEFPSLVEQATRIAADEANHFEASVAVAVAFTEEERKRLVNILERKLKGTVRLQEQIDPTLLGGFTVTAPGWNFDGSLKGKLERMKHALTQ
jgi:F-type H+-transporting ATPase subunit delta